MKGGHVDKFIYHTLKMKILHIPQRNIGLKKSVGGVKSILLEQIKWENKINGIEAKILICDKIEEKNPFFINKKSIKEDILDYKPDFIIFDGFWTIQHYFIAKFLKKNGIKYYIKPHGAFNKIAQRNSRIKFLKKTIAKFLFFNTYVKDSDGLIFLNEMEKINSTYRKNNEFILPNGIGISDVKFNKKKEKDSKINFIFLGRIDIFNKKLDILFEVLLRNKEHFMKYNVLFNFYGIGNDKNMKIFNSYLNKMPEIIKYHGIVYGKNKYKILKKNNIFILLSRFEGMPMGILEALSVGLPCFISIETGMGEYIERYNAGWVNKDKEKVFEDLQNCIKEYQTNPYVYRENSLNIIKNFYWNNIILNYSLVYERINQKCLK